MQAAILADLLRDFGVTLGALQNGRSRADFMAGDALRRTAKRLMGS